jgi:hypothetical protein
MVLVMIVRRYHGSTSPDRQAATCVHDAVVQLSVAFTGDRRGDGHGELFRRRAGGGWDPHDVSETRHTGGQGQFTNNDCDGRDGDGATHPE